MYVVYRSHDVAGPMTPQNQEVAGYINHSAKFVPYLHWRVVRLAPCAIVSHMWLTLGGCW